MKKSLMKNNNIMNTINNSLINLPTPLNISIMWNFGSLLGLCMMIQIISGLLLSLHYCPNINEAFNSIIHIMQDVNFGWLIRLFHMNGASMFFICLFLHISRGIYYNSFLYLKVWTSGVIIMLLLMMTAFLGYVLPWGQMSFWGATVITNLLSAIPYLGNSIVKWIWGGFSINNATLNRFYSFHFIMPFIIMFIIIFHLIFLHQTGSSNPLGINSNMNKIPFNPYFSIKDIMGFLILMFILTMICLIDPYKLSDPENYSKANPMITPIHIQPEWYFLFAYAILRSIPNKLGGVIALMMSILILLILPFQSNYMFKSSKFYFIHQILFWYFISSFMILTWVGMQPVEEPFILLSQLNSILYFLYFLFFNKISKYLDYFMYKMNN